MNDRMPLSELTDDDAFDVQLRATIARAEPMPPPPDRYLRRVRQDVAMRVGLALLVAAVVVGAFGIRSLMRANYRFSRLMPEAVLLYARHLEPTTMNAAVTVDPSPRPEPPAATTPAPLTEDEASRRVSGRQRRFEACFPEAAGSALVTIVISDAGESDVTVEDERELEAPVVACLHKVGSQLRWRSGIGGTAVEISLTPK